MLVIRGRFLHAADVELLRRITRAPVVNYFPDNPLDERLREPPLMEALATYDLVVVWSRRLADQLATSGVRRTAVVAFGYDPALYGPPPGDAVPRFDVAFVGSASPHRLRWLAELAGPARGPDRPALAAPGPGDPAGRRRAVRPPLGARGGTPVLVGAGRRQRARSRRT